MRQSLPAFMVPLAVMNFALDATGQSSMYDHFIGFHVPLNVVVHRQSEAARLSGVSCRIGDLFGASEVTPSLSLDISAYVSGL